MLDSIEKLADDGIASQAIIFTLSTTVYRFKGHRQSLSNISELHI